METAFGVVSKIFNIDNFKNYQMHCWEALVLKKYDCFVCQPTGSGKSIIFQAIPFLAFCLENPKMEEKLVLENCYFKALVISPLTSLMHDQMRYLQSKCVRVGCLSSAKDKEDKKDIEVSVI